MIPRLESKVKDRCVWNEVAEHDLKKVTIINDYGIMRVRGKTPLLTDNLKQRCINCTTYQKTICESYTAKYSK